tara:strand:- start:5372 stop:5821 length:450 start_codon:yes stop_codon:yes gene_type:complete
MSVTQNKARFVECGEGVIYDTQTRLIWQKRDTYQLTGKWMNWVQARDFIEQQNNARAEGYGDWRFPMSQEAKSLYDKAIVNKDYMGQKAHLPHEFPNGFGFLCWTGEVRNKIQAMRFGYRKGATMYDDIYRTSRGSTRLVRNVDKDFSF